MIAEFPVKTSARNELVDITEDVRQAARELGLKSGACIVYCPHTTAAIAITENADPGVKKDLLNYLQKLVPEKAGFSHSEGNSDAHIKSAVIGNSRAILVENKELVLGTWEGIFFCEFDGPRSRKVLVKALKE